MLAAIVARDPSGSFGVLSPYAHAPIEIEDVVWPTGAHYLLARRCFFDRARRERIRGATLAEARALAQEPGNYSWDDARRGTFADPHMYWQRSVRNLVRRVIFERATTDGAFAAALAGTQDRPIALDGPDDLVPDELWAGQLVEMRTRLKIADAATLRRWRLPPLVQHPEIPRGSIGWRMGYGEGYAIECHEWRATLSPAERARWDRAWAAAQAS